MLSKYIYFNPRSHEGSDDITTGGTAYFVHFNPRSHEGSDPRTYNLRYSLQNFNPRSHEGSDLSITISCPTFATFQSTLPRRERPTFPNSTRALIRFQSTLPRRERRSRTFWIGRDQRISIHAPTKGATQFDEQKRQDARYFNPRSHEGSDENMAYDIGPRIDFNPRSHEGSDDNANSQDALIAKFQSTLPRRERLLVSFDVCGYHRISIHAPTKGATSAAWCTVSRSPISIHAPTKGATG